MTFGKRLQLVMLQEEGHWWNLDLAALIEMVSKHFRRLYLMLFSPTTAQPDTAPQRMDLLWLRTRSFCVRDNYH